MKIMVFQHRMGWKAYREDYPETWEFGFSPEQAIGKLIITYARCWKERWPGLELI